MRRWCTERLPQETYFSLDGTHDMFWARPANESAIIEHCRRKYNVSYRSDWIAATSAFSSATSASNIVFSNGQYDPWRSGGVLTNLSSTVHAIDIEHGAHHLDLMFADPADPVSVQVARDQELAAIKQWVADVRSNAIES